MLHALWRKLSVNALCRKPFEEDAFSKMAEPGQFPRAQRPPRYASWRPISALFLREIATTYGRSALGYFWAILEPAAGIFLLTLIFSVAFRSPSIGTSFALFYASGILPFIAYLDVSQKVSVALRFSKPLLFYPRVTYTDALIARLLLNALTQLMVFVVVMAAIVLMFRLDLIIDFPALGLALAMTFSLAFGIGTLNCFLLSTFPIWERAWAIMNRPLFIISCIFFLFDDVPQPYQNILWYNPLVHLIGQMRDAIYPTYDGTYVSPLFVFTTAGVTLAFGLLMLRRYHRDIVNN